MSRYKVQYQGTAPGMGVVVRHFDSQEAARLWARQVGVDGRADIVNCEAEDRLSAAAPDLLAALESIINNGEHEFTDNNGWTPMLVVQMYERARAAIAKARGES